MRSPSDRPSQEHYTCPNLFSFFIIPSALTSLERHYAFINLNRNGDRLFSTATRALTGHIETVTAPGSPHPQTCPIISFQEIPEPFVTPKSSSPITTRNRPPGPPSRFHCGGGTLYNLALPHRVITSSNSLYWDSILAYAAQKRDEGKRLDKLEPYVKEQAMKALKSALGTPSHCQWQACFRSTAVRANFTFMLHVSQHCYQVEYASGTDERRRTLQRDLGCRHLCQLPRESKSSLS